MECIFACPSLSIFEWCDFVCFKAHSAKWINIIIYKILMVPEKGLVGVIALFCWQNKVGIVSTWGGWIRLEGRTSYVVCKGTKNCVNNL